MKIILIAAIGRNRELGLDGDMPWKNSLKKDLQFFKSQTIGHPVLMGRRTLESFHGRLLPKRENLVLTSADLPEREHLHLYRSLDEFRKDYEDTDETVFVIGGGSLYGQMVDEADEIILTEIESDFDADTWFPEFDQGKYTRTVLGQDEEAGFSYTHVRYTKK